MEEKREEDKEEKGRKKLSTEVILFVASIKIQNRFVCRWQRNEDSIILYSVITTQHNPKNRHTQK
jgi:hypothetical protein